jgi:CRP-like cAMP-binding protein
MKDQSKQAPTSVKQQDFAPSELIFDEGEEGDACYLVVSGEVEIRRGVHGGSPSTLALLRQGDIFGEMALCGDGRRMAAAIARKKTRVIVISKATFEKELRSVDPVMRKVIALLTKRLKQVTSDFAAYRRGEHWKEN